MSGRVSLPPLPAPRTVAAWWTTLAPLGPTALLAGWFTVLRTEVLVEASVLVPLDPITSAVLAVVATADGMTAAAVDRILRLGEPRVRSALAAASHLGYVTTESTRLTLTDTGRAALANGLATPSRSRRRFAFRDGHSLPLPDPGPLLVGPTQTTTLGMGTGWQLVVDATARSPQWKADAQFSTDFERVVAASELSGPERWRAVPAEGTDAFAAVIVSTQAGDVAGFVAAAPDWVLASVPTFEFRGEAASAAFPELFGAASEDDVRGAWLSWAKSRTVPLEPATVSLNGHTLTVTVSAEFRDWLQANRADVFAGGTWVWIGEGEVRRAAVLDIRV